MTSKIGMALTDNVLAGMNEEEKMFWHDFLSEAKELINNLRERGLPEPFQPPDSLKNKYKKAITDYDGGKYCQVRHLERIFMFS